MYKAQSCGSIVRDKINPNPSGAVPAVLTDLMAARDGNNNSNSGKGKSGRGKIFNRRMKDEQRSNNGLLQPMLGCQQRLLGSSEGDINQNLNLSSTSTPSLLVDGNNNSNSNDNLEQVASERGESDMRQRRGESVPIIDRRKSTVEPLERCKVDAESSIVENGVGAAEDFEDIDGSASEDHEENVAVNGGVLEAVDGVEGAASHAPLFKGRHSLGAAISPPPSGLCSS